MKRIGLLLTGSLIDDLQYLFAYSPPVMCLIIIPVVVIELRGCRIVVDVSSAKDLAQHENIVTVELFLFESRANDPLNVGMMSTAYLLYLFEHRHLWQTYG